MHEEERLVPLDDLADRLGVSTQTIHQMRYRGDGPVAVRIGRTLKFRHADIEAWIESRVESAS